MCEIIQIDRCTKLLCKDEFLCRRIIDENMISSPVNPSLSDIISSVSDEQSVPHPSSFKIRRIVGFGVAFTAKNSLNPYSMKMPDITFLHFL